MSDFDLRISRERLYYTPAPEVGPYGDPTYWAISDGIFGRILLTGREKPEMGDIDAALAVRDAP